MLPCCYAGIEDTLLKNDPLPRVTRRHTFYIFIFVGQKECDCSIWETFEGVESRKYTLHISFYPVKTKRRFWVNFHLFPPISVYFPPIFHLKWYPIRVINSSVEPICCFSAHMFTVSAYFPPIFLSFSAYFPPNLQPIFRRSCLAGVYLI